MQPSSQNNRMLAVALGVSLAVHALALAVRFVTPTCCRMRSIRPGAGDHPSQRTSQCAASQPEAHAQANLDGGGANDAGRGARRCQPDASSAKARRSRRRRRAPEQARQQPQKLRCPTAAI